MRVGTTPAVTVDDGEAQRRISMRLDLSEPDFVLSPTFPMLIANSIRWLAAQRAMPLDLIAGQPLALTPPPNASVQILGPDGHARTIRRLGGRVVVSDTDTAGRYRVRINGSEHLVAVLSLIHI